MKTIKEKIKQPIREHLQKIEHNQKWNPSPSTEEQTSLEIQVSTIKYILGLIDRTK